MALHEIDGDLRAAENTLRHWEREFPKVARMAVKARINYDLAWADAIEKVQDEAAQKGEKVTIPVQEARALKMVASQFKRVRMAEQNLENAKKLMGLAETTLTSIQSRLKLEQIEAGLSGMRT